MRDLCENNFFVNGRFNERGLAVAMFRGAFAEIFCRGLVVRMRLPFFILIQSRDLVLQQKLYLCGQIGCARLFGKETIPYRLRCLCIRYGNKLKRQEDSRAALRRR